MRYCIILIFFIFFSCKAFKPNAYEYEIVIRANNGPFVPKKFISYKNSLFAFMYKRYDSTVLYVRKDSTATFTTFDTTERWIINNKAMCYTINTFAPNFSITAKDSLSNKMEGGLGSGYVFDKELRDTAIDGMTYAYSDSSIYNRTDSISFKYFFIKNLRINTIYTILGIGHKDPSFKYAGFIMNDYKNNYHFTNLITKLKEANPPSVQIYDAIYSRFKRM